MSGLTQNLLSSLTGNLPKAILYVRDINAVKKGGLMSSLSSMTSVCSDGNITTLGKKELTKYEGFLGIEVQYNPNSIQLDSIAGGRQVQYSGGGLGNACNNQITQIIQPMATTMSFQLVFDDVDPSDAFMINSFALTGEGYSVRKQVDGLMSLLVSDATRQVVFFWAQMCFSGEVTNVNSRYTMFNPSGNPVRGVVDITIRQGSGTDGTDYDYTYEDKYWNTAFDKVFVS